MARPFKEIGVYSDNSPSWGMNLDDFIVELRGRQGIRKYREMRENDPIIGAILTAMDMMLRGVEWRVEGGSESDNAWLDHTLQNITESSWEEFIADVLSFLPYGFSVFEIVPRRDPETGTIKLRKLAPRAQWTIDRFEATLHGEILGVHQQSAQKSSFIPYGRLLHFRTTSINNTPSGRSVLRSAYTSWKAQNTIKYFEGVGIERELNGMPMWSIPGSWMSDEAEDWQKSFVASAKRIARDVKRNEQGYIIKPSDLWENEDGKLATSEMVRFDLISSEGKRDIDTGPVIMRYQQDMARSVMADFVMLGSNDRGSFALSKSKADLFLQALKGYSTSIAAELNRKLVPMLWEMNGFTSDMPTIVPGRVAPVDLEELGHFVQRMALAGVQLFPDEDLDKHLRDVAGLPEPNPQPLPEEEPLEETLVGETPEEDLGDEDD